MLLLFTRNFLTQKQPRVNHLKKFRTVVGKIAKTNAKKIEHFQKKIRKLQKNQIIAKKIEKLQKNQKIKRESKN